MTDTRTMIDSAYGSPTLELTAAIDALRDCEHRRARPVRWRWSTRAAW